MPYADLGDFKLYYEEHGVGEPLIFLHGFSLDRRMWTPQIPYFKTSYRVILPDAKGHGESDAPPTAYSRADRVNDLLQLADILEIERFHLVGLSMGGSTALGFALAHQHRLRSLTLVSTGAAGYSAGRRFTRLDEVGRAEGAEAAKEQWMQWSLAWYRESARAHIRPLIEEMMRGYSGAVWKDKMRGKYDKEQDLERVHTIDTPTFILAGALDRIFLPLARLLHAKIAGSQLSVYEQTGHMINLEQPDRFNRDLSAFLAARAVS
ncbi:MAG: alpha/beta fold hydrolase [candidate division Zixibacteria bacterium]|jgi:pimeloyl-ACP methyl ester carboxylesterase|nr:alpha/beta fold hydrolase [candidate division Zixibacteria bacterium]